MKDLLRGLRHILVQLLTRIAVLVVAHELGTAQIRKDQRLLNHDGSCGKYRHRALIVANHFANAIPSTGKVDGDVVAAEHGSDLLVDRLPLEPGLCRRLTVVLSLELLR